MVAAVKRLSADSEAIGVRFVTSGARITVERFVVVWWADAAVRAFPRVTADARTVGNVARDRHRAIQAVVWCAQLGTHGIAAKPSLTSAAILLGVDVRRTRLAPCAIPGVATRAEAADGDVAKDAAGVAAAVVAICARWIACGVVLEERSTRAAVGRALEARLALAACRAVPRVSALTGAVRPVTSDA